MQEGCPGHGCEVYAVNLSSSVFQRLHRWPKGLSNSSGPSASASADPLVAAYLASVPPAVRRRLTPLVEPLAVQELPADVKRSTATVIRFSLGAKDGLVARLVTQRRFPSMTASVNGLPEQPCHDWRTQSPVCSSCAPVARRVGGRSIPSFACRGIGQRRDAAGAGKPCSCAVLGEVRTLRVARLRTGAQVLGNEILVEPWRFAQNAMDGGSSTRLDFGWSQHAGTELFSPDLKAYRSAAGVVVVGSVAHARTANGTFVPVIGTFPRRLLGDAK